MNNGRRSSRTHYVLLVTLIGVWIGVFASSAVVFHIYRGQHTPPRPNAVARRPSKASQFIKRNSNNSHASSSSPRHQDGAHGEAHGSSPVPRQGNGSIIFLNASVNLTEQLHFDDDDQYDALLVAGRRIIPPTAPPADVPQVVCDAFSVPFSASMECDKYLRDPSNWVRIAPLAPRFEQRTIKFTVTLADGNTAILKVPQALFPSEPFSELGAYLIDRLLAVHRIPPTALAIAPLATLEAVAQSRVAATVQMVQEFNTQNLTWAQWVSQDFVEFVRLERSGRFMVNSTHVWCSVQLVLHDVVPLLVSQLKLPYSKLNPGWHRWFHPAWDGFDALWTKSKPMAAALLAVSQLAMFDFVTLNNDRSPNKNNFVARGCLNGECAVGKKPSVRAQRGLFATFVHLDQGMAFNGFQQPHNPLAKPKNSTFCVFYGPFLESVEQFVRHVSERVLLNQTASTVSRRKALLNALQSELVQAMHPAVVNMHGRNKLYLVGQNMVQLLERAVQCVSRYGFDRVVLTARTPWLTVV